MNIILYVFINIVLWVLLIIVLIKKYYVIKFANVKSISFILTVLVISYFDYAFFGNIINDHGLLNLFETTFMIFVLILLNASLFFEITD